MVSGVCLTEPSGAQVNLWLPSTVAFSKGTKAERMATFGMKEHQVRLAAEKEVRSKADQFHVNSEVSAVLEKADAYSWLRTSASGRTPGLHPPEESDPKRKSPKKSPRRNGATSPAKFRPTAGDFVLKSWILTSIRWTL